MKHSAVLFFALSLLAAGRVAAFEFVERIYPADTKLKELRFVAKSDWAKENLKKVVVGYVRDDMRYMNDVKDDVHDDNNDYEKLPSRVEGDAIVVPDVILRGEFRHTFVIDLPEAKGRKRHCVLPVISLLPDLFALRPFKGSIHQHSKVSDGAGTPAQHIQYARTAGFDFVAVTDHGKYEQNPMAIAFAAETGCGIEVYPGEEMHSPGAALHSLCIGAPEKMSRKRTPEFGKEIAPKLAELKKRFPGTATEELRCTAEALWVVDNARKHGAKLIVYCHPQWVRANRLHALPIFNRIMLREAPFDAIEAVNGSVGKTGHRNAVNLAELYEMAAETGKVRPLTYGSDSHNPTKQWFFKRGFNLIFAPDASVDSFAEAVKTFHSVGAYSDHKDGPTIFFGPKRMVWYACFLRDIGFFVNHDKLAAQQAALLKKYIEGDKSVKPEIETLAKEIPASTETYFYKAAPKK